MLRLISMLFISAATAATIVATPSGGSAQGPAITRFAGQELRTTLWTGDYAQYHLWRFLPDGAVRGVYTGNRSLGRVNLHIERNDTGTWAEEGGALCIQWRTWFAGARNCYRIEKTQGIWIKANGVSREPSFTGTLTPYPP